MKRFRKLTAVFLSVIIMSSSLATYAAVCPGCEAGGALVDCYTQGTNISHSSHSHSGCYSENGMLYPYHYTVAVYEDRISWICPRGHGVVSSMIHHVEHHTDSHCRDLDYYY